MVSCRPRPHAGCRYREGGGQNGGHHGPGSPSSVLSPVVVTVAAPMITTAAANNSNSVFFIAITFQRDYRRSQVYIGFEFPVSRRNHVPGLVVLGVTYFRY